MATTTIQDVAKAAKVSPATVSRVLNGYDVSAERTSRVQEAVRALGYQPNGAARALRRQVADVWSAIVADVENPFFTSVVRGLEDAARAHGYRVILCNSDEELDRERDYFDVAIAERVSGVVIAVASTRASRLDALLENNIPVVAIDRRPVGHQVDCVLVNNKLGALQATEHLLEGGARRVACITGPSRISTANSRLAGARQAVRSAGLELMVSRRDFRVHGGHAATMELFESSDPPPDALFVANNLMTVGAMTALRELGLRVPDDVLVVGFDDAAWTELTDPQLTVVAQPTREIGTTAAELLVTHRRDRKEPREVVLEPSLIVRQSSRR